MDIFFFTIPKRIVYVKNTNLDILNKRLTDEGKEETKKFLENLGFVAGGAVTVIAETGGNLIVNVKDSRIAIGRDMAAKIMVD